MKKTLFQFIKIAVARAFVLSLILGGIGFSFASVSEKIPPQGQIDGGSIYQNWIQKIFVNPPANLKTALAESAVVQAASLADENGAEALWGNRWSSVFQNGKETQKSSVSIGEKLLTTETDKALRVVGNSPVMKIEARSGNPEIKIGMLNAHGAVYYDSTAKSLNVWNGENGLSLKGERANFPVDLKVYDTKVLLADIWCTDGLLRGFDANGNPLCTPICTDTITTNCVAMDNWCRTDAPGITYDNCRIYTPSTSPQP